MKSHIMFLSFLLVFFGSISLNAGIQSVAIMPFENTMKDSGLDWLSIGIPETITNDLQAIKGITLVERMQLRKVIDEQKLQLTGMIDDKTAVKVGKIIGADILVVGAFQKQADTIRLTARFVDVKTGAIIQTAKVTGKMANIFDLQDNIVKELMRNLNIELKQSELEKLGEKPTESLEAYEHFGQGVLLQAKKDYKGATEELGKAIKSDPKYTAAKEKFKEAFWSLNKSNYWTLESTLQSGKNSSKTISTRKGGGGEDFNGVPAFSYINEASGNLNESKLTSISKEYYSKRDDGIYMLGAKVESETAEAGLGHVSTLLVNDSPALCYPYDMAVGKKWTDSSNSSYKMVTDSKDLPYYEMQLKNITSTEIIRKETITVPAGTFDCFVIKSILNSDAKVGNTNVSTEMFTTTWFSPGIGFIKYEMESGVKGQEKNLSSVKAMLIDYYIEE